MASWTQKQTGLTISEVAAVSDGSNIYYDAGNGSDIYKYDPATNTVTQISNSASWEASSYLGSLTAYGVGLCWFGGGLYAAVVCETSPGVYQTQVWRYGGSGTSWTKLYTDTDNNGTNLVQFSTDDTYLVLAYYGTPSTGKHSTDGSTWSNSTLDSQAKFGGFSFGCGSWPLGIGTNSGDGSGSWPYAIYTFSAGTWTQRELTIASLKYLAAAGPDNFWKNDSGTYKRTTDFITYYTPADNRIPAWGFNLSTDMGYASPGGTFTFYRLVAGEWDAGEAVGSVVNFRQYIRLANGDTFALFAAQIWQRDEPIDPVTSLTYQDADIDADGAYLYIGVLGNGTPQVLKMPTALDTDPTVAYNPGAGSEIRVVCGDLQADRVWAVGDFGSSYVVLYDGPSGRYWYSDTQSDAWYGPARPVHLGPMADDTLMTTSPNDTTLWESYFLAGAGPYWRQVNTGLPFEVAAIDRLDIDPDKLLIGSYWYNGGGLVAYSPSGGDAFQTIINSLTAAVTTVIFG